jgi:hypothetical protein
MLCFVDNILAIVLIKKKVDLVSWIMGVLTLNNISDIL